MRTILLKVTVNWPDYEKENVEKSIFFDDVIDGIKNDVDGIKIERHTDENNTDSTGA